MPYPPPPFIAFPTTLIVALLRFLLKKKKDVEQSLSLCFKLARRGTLGICGFAVLGIFLCGVAVISSLAVCDDYGARWNEIICGIGGNPSCDDAPSPLNIIILVPISLSVSPSLRRLGSSNAQDRGRTVRKIYYCHFLGGFFLQGKADHLSKNRWEVIIYAVKYYKILIHSD